MDCEASLPLLTIHFRLRCFSQLWLEAQLNVMGVTAQRRVQGDFWGFVCLMLAALPETLGFRFPVHHQFRMQAAKHFCHMAIPANRAVSSKDLGKLLGF